MVPVLFIATRGAALDPISDPALAGLLSSGITHPNFRMGRANANLHDRNLMNQSEHSGLVLASGAAARAKPRQP